MAQFLSMDVSEQKKVLTVTARATSQPGSRASAAVPPLQPSELPALPTPLTLASSTLHVNSHQPLTSPFARAALSSFDQTHSQVPKAAIPFLSTPLECAVYAAHAIGLP